MKHQPKEAIANMVIRVYSLDELLLSQYVHAHRHLYLQPEIAEQLTYEAGNASKGASFALELQLVNTEDIDNDSLKTMVNRHFNYQQRLELQQKKQVLKEGYKGLLIAFGFMLVMTTIYQLIGNFLPDNKLSTTIQDSLVILAWVALWRPADLLLYEWHPHKHKAALYKRLSTMPVSVQRVVVEG